MLRIVLCIIVMLFPIFSVSAADSTVGESLELGFYSRIHDNIDGTIDTLRKKEISKFRTFSGFGKCRPSIPWIDIEPMNEQILRDIENGDLSSLSATMEKNKRLGVSDSDSFANLASCLRETYQNMADVAAKDERTLAQMGVIGIYTDGNTENSDYDIVDDIEKMNAIIFTERLDYIGRLNTAKDSFAAMAEGVPVGSVVSGGSAGGGSDAPIVDIDIPTTSPETLASLGISDICSVPETPSSVSNIADSDFLSELETVLAGGSPALGGATYGAAAPISTLQLDNVDFFHTLPCTDNFCIRVKMIPGEITLMGGTSYSIESLIDKHTSIMTPIANSNLALQKMAKNSYEIPCVKGGCSFKDLISGSLYLEDRTQKKKKVEKEYTSEMQEAEFEEMRRCAYVSAGLPSDMNRANIVGGAGYLPRIGRTTDNKTGDAIGLATLDPEDAALASCMDIAIGESRGKYYESFSTDLTEFEAFTTALVHILVSGTEEHKALDKKKIH